MVDLSFAGRQGHNHPALQAISRAKVGDQVTLIEEKGIWVLHDERGRVLGRMAQKNFLPPANSKFVCGEIAAILRWRKDDCDENYFYTLRRDAWEVVVPELVFEEI